MSKYKYIYKGKEEVHIPYIGTFKPGDEVYDVNKPITHPDFEEVTVKDKDFRSTKKEK